MNPPQNPPPPPPGDTLELVLYSLCTGNNIYGEDIRHTLLNDTKNRTQYIVMDLIQPEMYRNVIVREEYTNVHTVDVIPELGIVGIFLR